MIRIVLGEGRREAVLFEKDLSHLPASRDGRRLDDWIIERKVLHVAFLRSREDRKGSLSLKDDFRFSLPLRELVFTLRGLGYKVEGR